MATMNISQVISELERLKVLYGDVPVVLWDLDTTGYRSFFHDSIEPQKMKDGSVRLSVGINDYDDEYQPEPAKRPI